MQSPSLVTRSDASYGRRRAGTVSGFCSRVVSQGFRLRVTDAHRQACNVCRSRKTKCDNRRPVCGFCAATGGECSYSDESQDHSRLDRGSLLILQRVGELEQSLAKLITETAGSNSAAQAPRSVLSPSAVPINAPVSGLSPTPDYPHSPRRAKLEEVVTIAESGDGQGGNPPTADIIHASTEMTVESLLTWPVFQNVLPEPHTPLLTLLGQAEQRTHIDNAVSFNFELKIDSQAVGRLVANFLSSNHIKNPIFDIATLWKDVRLFVDNGPQWDGRSCLVVSIAVPFKTK